MRDRNRNKRTFYDDTNYFFGVDGSRSDSPVLVTEQKDVIPMENPYFIAQSNKAGLFQSFIDSNFSNAIGDKLKANVKKVGGQISNAVKDTIKNPSKAIKNLGSEIKKGTNQLKDKAKEVAQKGIGGVKMIYLAVPRQAFLGLVALNFQGLATRFLNKTAESKKNILDKWERWGGDRGSLEGSVNTGSKKKPLFISKKKKAGFIAQYNSKNKSFDGEFSYPFGIDDVGELLISSTPTLIGFMPLFKKEPSVDPKIDADIDAGEEAEDNKDGGLTPEEMNSQKQLIEKQINDIKTNPNLTQEEKNELLKPLQELNEESFFSKYKWYLVGGSVIALALIYFAYKNKQD
jgi:hypothetical protein